MALTAVIFSASESSRRVPRVFNSKQTGYAMNLSWQPKQFLSDLQGHLTLARARLNASNFVQRARADDLTAHSLGASAVFFLLVDQALYLDTVLTVEKLFDASSNRSISKYLKKCEQDFDSLPIHDRSFLTRAKVKEHMDKIESEVKIYQNVRTFRDKWLAHHDPEAFDNPSKFVAENFVSYNDLRKLIEIAQEVLLDHFRGYGSSLSPGLSNEDDFLWLLDVLLRYDSVRSRWGTDRISDGEAANEMFHHEYSRRKELFEQFPQLIGRTCIFDLDNLLDE